MLHKGGNMKLELKIKKGMLKKRYKRFFADIFYENQLVTAHVPNTGSLKSCLFADQDCYFTESDDPNRKLKYTLEIVSTPTGFVGVNTRTPNEMIKDALKAGWLAHWKEFPEVKPEFKLNAETRLDFRISKGDKHHFIEVKNVTLKNGTSAEFPDAETTRGQKHLKELMLLKEQGHGAEIVFFIQRNDVDSFKPAKDIDPEYARLLKQADDAGVRITPIVCDVTSSSVSLTNKVLPIQW